MKWIKQWAVKVPMFALSFLVVCGIYFAAIVFLLPFMMLERLLGLGDESPYPPHLNRRWNPDGTCTWTDPK